MSLKLQQQQRHQLQHQQHQQQYYSDRLIFSNQLVDYTKSKNIYCDICYLKLEQKLQYYFNFTKIFGLCIQSIK